PTRPGRRAKLLLPVGAKRVIFPAFIGVREYFVGFVDLLKLLFRLLIAGIDIRVILARQLAERLLDVVHARAFRDTQHLIIILIIHVLPLFTAQRRATVYIWAAELPALTLTRAARSVSLPIL